MSEKMTKMEKAKAFMGRAKKTICITLAVGFLLTLIVCTWGHRWCQGWYSLQERRTVLGDSAAKNKFADRDKKEVGVYEDMAGNGSYWNKYKGLYNIDKIPHVEIGPLESAYVVNKLGIEPLPKGRVTGDDVYKGPAKELITTGMHRLNPYGYDHVIVNWIEIKPGYVGLQNYKEDQVVDDKIVRPAGLQSDVLHPGYYPNNPIVREIIPFEVGRRVLDIHVTLEEQDVTIKDEEGNETIIRVLGPKQGTGVAYKLRDNRWFHHDLSWPYEVRPENVPYIYKNVAKTAHELETILQSEVISECSYIGSNLKTDELSKGEQRTLYQSQVHKKTQKWAADRKIITHEPRVRRPYLDYNMAEITKEKRMAEVGLETEKFTQAEKEALTKLNYAQELYNISNEDYRTRTDQLAANELREGERKAAKIREEGDQLAAVTQMEADEIDKQSVELLGQAEADVLGAEKGAIADRLQKLVTVHGSPAAYNSYVYADNLPDNFKVLHMSNDGKLITNAAPIIDLFNGRQNQAAAPMIPSRVPELIPATTTTKPGGQPVNVTINQEAPRTWESILYDKVEQLEKLVKQKKDPAKKQAE